MFEDRIPLPQAAFSCLNVLAHIQLARRAHGSSHGQFEPMQTSCQGHVQVWVLEVWKVIGPLQK